MLAQRHLRGFILTDSAAYSESVVTGQAYGGGDETIRTLARRFDNIRTEAMRASESTALLREMIGRDRLTQEQLQGLKARGSAARRLGFECEPGLAEEALPDARLRLD